MTVRDLTGTTAVVTGASRGFGRATAVALAGRGARVVGVARSHDGLAEVARILGDAFTPVVADAADREVALRVVARYRPETLVLNAGAIPTPAPLTGQTWQTFSENWHVDVQHVFHFLQAALLTPLPPGAVVASLSSGAALRGSPMSGGYAGAKATILTLSAYAGLQSQHGALGIRFVAVLPQLSPATALGRLFTDVYAERAGVGPDRSVATAGGLLTTDRAAAGIVDLVTDDDHLEPAYLLGAGGVTAVPGRA